MSWVSVHVPAAIILLGGGFLICFLGYRLLRALLALYGCIAGVVTATLFVGEFELWFAIVITITAGLAGAVLAVVAYLAGVAVFGAALGVMLLNLAWRPGDDPNVWLVLAACLVGALITLAIRRYVLIFATAFGGALTVIVGGLALTGNAAAVAATSGDLQSLPPVADLRSNMEFVVGWSALGTLAVLVQLRDGGRRKLRRERNVDK